MYTYGERHKSDFLVPYTKKGEIGAGTGGEETPIVRRNYVSKSILLDETSRCTTTNVEKYSVILFIDTCNVIETNLPATTITSFAIQ